MHQIVHGIMPEFQPPTFDPHPVYRGGHLQTIAPVRSAERSRLAPKRHVVSVSDGDSIVLHDDRPASWADGDSSLLLLHGLSGCYLAPYMVRLAEEFVQRGTRVFRMDMRGCGAAAKMTSNLAHAGRSDDVIAALDLIAMLCPSGPIRATGVSLGAGQLLRAVGRIGEGATDEPSWFQRLQQIAAVAPPLDLRRCSDNMQRLVLRPYNFYFIRNLIARAPAGVKQRADFQERIAGPRPRTLRELDDRITAPLSGFVDAADYYAQSSANLVTRHNPVRTLVLAAEDDPIVPIGCFVDDPSVWSDTTRLVVTGTGGHVGFVDRTKRCWMDDALIAWFTE
ncbi:MAG: YheT family hydrolase [Rubripirellula sp.]